MSAPNHYENFPVGSIVLPRRLRRPIHAVYAFARYADDLADEGDATLEERKSSLHFLARELDKIGAGQTPETALMQRLQAEAVVPFSLPTSILVNWWIIRAVPPILSGGLSCICTGRPTPSPSGRATASAPPCSSSIFGRMWRWIGGKTAFTCRRTIWRNSA